MKKKSIKNKKVSKPKIAKKKAVKLVKKPTKVVTKVSLKRKELEDVVKVLMLGAKKYSPDNWNQPMKVMRLQKLQ